VNKVIELNDFVNMRNSIDNLVCCSGGFDPIHMGHISYLQESAKLGDKLVVIVNNDNFLVNKKGNYFMPLHERCLIVAAIEGVDYVIPYLDAPDDTVCHALNIINPDIFSKGGDRRCQESIPEWEVCFENNIKLKLGVDLPQYFSSSSKYLESWIEKNNSSVSC